MLSLSLSLSLHLLILPLFPLNHSLFLSQHISTWSFVVAWMVVHKDRFPHSRELHIFAWLSAKKSENIQHIPTHKHPTSDQFVYLLLLLLLWWWWWWWWPTLIEWYSLLFVMLRVPNPCSISLPYMFHGLWPRIPNSHSIYWQN